MPFLVSNIRPSWKGPLPVTYVILAKAWAVGLSKKGTRKRKTVLRELRDSSLDKSSMFTWRPEWAKLCIFDELDELDEFDY